MGVNVASIPAGGLSVVAVAAIDGSNANTRRWNGGIGLLRCSKGGWLCCLVVVIFLSAHRDYMSCLPDFIEHFLFRK